MLELGDLVKIAHFDDGLQGLRSKSNLWRIVGFKFNKSKSIIRNVDCVDSRVSKTILLGPLRSISTWKLEREDDFC